MSWQREKHHMDLALGEHAITLINPTVSTSEGEPQRHLLKIRMGEGKFEYHVGPNTVEIKLGGDFQVDDAGKLFDSEGNLFDPVDFEKHLIAALNAHTAKLRRYAQRHGAQELKPVRR